LSFGSGVLSAQGVSEDRARPFLCLIEGEERSMAAERHALGLPGSTIAVLDEIAAHSGSLDADTKPRERLVPNE
jgi:hypothetical protein